MKARLIGIPGTTGSRLVAEAWGDANAPAVICAHGVGQTRHAWGDTARGLAQAGYHAVSVDLPGHGDSEWYADGHYGGKRMTTDLQRICEHFGAPLAWVGASLGGLLGLGLQYRYAPLSALILVDIAPRMEAAGVERVLTFMRGRPDGFASIQEAADYVAAYLPNRKRPRSTDGLQKNLRQRSDGRYVWHWDPRVMEPGTQEERMQQSDYEGAARSLQIPALLIRGQHSDVISPAGAQEFQAMVKDSEYVDLHGAAHMVAGDVNDAFTDCVIEFLDRRYRPLAEPAVGKPVSSACRN